MSYIPHVILVYMEADQEVAYRFINYFNHQDIVCTEFGKPFSIESTVESDTRWCLVLLSSKALANKRFISAWREITLSKTKQFIIRIDQTDIPPLSHEFQGLHYFDLNFRTPSLLTEALKQKKPLQQHPVPIKTTENLDRSDYEQGSVYYSMQSLRRAWAKISKYALAHDAYCDEYSFDQYNYHIDANLLTLEQLLRNRRYKLQPLLSIQVPKSMSKQREKRTLYQAQPETAIILQAVCEAISPSLESEFIEQSYGNRFIVEAREDTTDIFKDYWAQYKRFRRDIIRFAHNHPSYFYHNIDIKQFYPRINLSRLFDLVKNRIHDQITLSIIQDFVEIESMSEKGYFERVQSRGLPAGIPLCHLLANFYLHSIDLEMKEITKTKDGDYGYFRYVDDIVIFGSSIQQTENTRDYLERLLRRLINLGDEEEATLNLEKSTKEPFPATNLELFRSKLLALYGPLEMSNYPNLTSEERSDIAQTIYDLLFAGSEHPEETEALSRFTPMGIRRLLALEHPNKTVKELVSAMLRKIAFPPSNIRYLVSVLLDSKTNEKLSDLPAVLDVENSTIHVSILQALRNTPPDIIDDKVWQWIVDQLHNTANVVIAREAALTLTNAPNTVLDAVNIIAVYNLAHDIVEPYILILIFKLNRFNPITYINELFERSDSTNIDMLVRILDQHAALLPKVNLPLMKIANSSESVSRLAYILLKSGSLKTIS